MTIPIHLLEFYISANYHVSATTPFKIKVNQFSDELKKLHFDHNVSCSAFLTAHNPFSELTSDELNNTYQESLINEIKTLSLKFVKGYGESSVATTDWQEASLLVLGLELDDAQKLAVKYKQNAFIFSHENCIPQLVICA